MKIKQRLKNTVLAVLSTAFLAMLPVVGAQAVFISPVLIVIKDKQVATRITVNNRSDKPRLIKLSWERRSMTADGEMVKLEEGETLPGYRPADPFIRFSPRQFVLQPRSYQKIRMIAMRPGDMEPGEYRSHILLEERPVVDDPENRVVAETDADAEKGEGEGADATAEAENTGQKRASFGGQVVVEVNKSTPVFLLHGETHIDLNFTRAAIITQDDQKKLDVAVANNSTRSIYAQLRLVCKQGNGEVVSESSGILRLYPEAKNVQNSFKLRNIDPSACAQLDVLALGYKDFEYDDREIARTSVAM